MTDNMDAAEAMTYVVCCHMQHQCVDYYAWKEAMQTSTNPIFIMLRRKVYYLQATQHVLKRPDDKFITVQPCSSLTSYKVHAGNDEYDDFADGGAEVEHRHPGTHYDSDGEDKHPEESAGQDYSPCTTKAARLVTAIAFAGPGGVSCELLAAYSMQLTVRVDNARKAINYDCYEYKPPHCNGINGDLPINRNIGLFQKIFTPEHTQDDESDDDDDSTDSWYDKPFQPAESTSSDMKRALQVQGISGGFAMSRVCRFRLPLSRVIGARLQSMKLGAEAMNNIEGDEDVPCVLVLEVSEPPPYNKDVPAFCARRVFSRYLGENKFQAVEDWTPNQVASKASRHYVFGGLKELKDLVAHLCALDKDGFAKLVASSNPSNNSLTPETDLSYAAAPDFATPSSRKKHGKEQTAKAKEKMTVEQVNTIFRNKGFHGHNFCFKRAVLCGHVPITDETTKDTVIYEGTCCYCSKNIECTVQDILDQSCYAGLDYEDGGEMASIKCDECGHGVYLTMLCEGNPHFDSGKFHNHCTECPDFGVCLSDYREAHCLHCGEHYFAGLSGFPCPHCGGGKCKPLRELPPPPFSAWDGQVEGEREQSEILAVARALMASSD